MDDVESPSLSKADSLKRAQERPPLRNMTLDVDAIDADQLPLEELSKSELKELELELSLRLESFLTSLISL